MLGLAAFSRSLAGPALLAMGLGLSACTVTPLYSTTPSGSTLQAELAAISVLPVSDRVSQIVRNELVFVFTGGGLPAEPIYELSLAASAGGGGLSIVAPGNVASTIVRVTVRYTLVELATGSAIHTGTVSAETRFQQSNQAFANLRARSEAEERAAVAAADLARVEISSALAVRP